MRVRRQETRDRNQLQPLRLIEQPAGGGDEALSVIGFPVRFPKLRSRVTFVEIADAAGGGLPVEQPQYLLGDHEDVAIRLLPVGQPRLAKFDLRQPVAQRSSSA